MGSRSCSASAYSGYWVSNGSLDYSSPPSVCLHHDTANGPRGLANYACALALRSCLQSSEHILCRIRHDCNDGLSLVPDLKRIDSEHLACGHHGIIQWNVLLPNLDPHMRFLRPFVEKISHAASRGILHRRDS